MEEFISVSFVIADADHLFFGIIVSDEDNLGKTNPCLRKVWIFVLRSSSFVSVAPKFVSMYESKSSRWMDTTRSVHIHIFVPFRIFAKAKTPLWFSPYWGVALISTGTKYAAWVGNLLLFLLSPFVGIEGLVVLSFRHGFVLQFFVLLFFRTTYKC